MGPKGAVCGRSIMPDPWSTLGFLESPITASRFGSEELKEPMRLIQSMCARLPVWL